VNAPISFGTIKLGPATADFMALYSELQVQLVLSDEQVDPLQEGLDVTLRIAELESSSLIARKIVPIERVVCASSDYLEGHGIPAHPTTCEITIASLMGFSPPATSGS
jgi:DNA-binding transcriptional LysR family regulator